MTENFIQQLETIIQENSELKTKIAELEIQKRNLYLRERLYQSELSTVKTTLYKICENIDTTPHSRDEEYQKLVYGKNEDCSDE